MALRIRTNKAEERHPLVWAPCRDFRRGAGRRRAAGRVPDPRHRSRTVPLHHHGSIGMRDIFLHHDASAVADLDTPHRPAQAGGSGRPAGRAIARAGYGSIGMRDGSLHHDASAVADLDAPTVRCRPVAAAVRRAGPEPARAMARPARAGWLPSPRRLRGCRPRCSPTVRRRPAAAAGRPAGRARA